MAVVVLVFERRPQRFGATVVPADPGRTHRPPQTGIYAGLGHRPLRVLTRFNRWTQHLNDGGAFDGTTTGRRSATAAPRLRGAHRRGRGAGHAPRASRQPCYGSHPTTGLTEDNL